MKPAKKSTQKSPKSAAATWKPSVGFTAEERAAMKEHLANQGLEGVGNSSKQFGEFIKSEYAKWAKVVKISGATVD